MDVNGSPTLDQGDSCVETVIAFVTDLNDLSGNWLGGFEVERGDQGVIALAADERRSVDRAGDLVVSA